MMVGLSVLKQVANDMVKLRKCTGSSVRALAACWWDKHQNLIRHQLFFLFLNQSICTVKPVLNNHSKKPQKLVCKTDYCLMQVKSIAECSKGSILQYFRPYKLPFTIKTFVLSIFKWPLKTGFTV